MDGLNHGFKVSPTYFLAHNVLTMNPSILGAINDPRELTIAVEHFDIRPLPYPEACELKFFMDAGQVQHFGDRIVGMGGRVDASKPADEPIPAIRQAVGVIWRPAKNIKPPPREAAIKAYWVPYEADQTYETILGADADFCFTAGLSGCTVMVSGSPTAPRVAHINRTDSGSEAFNSVVVDPTRANEAMSRRRAQMTGQSFASRMPKTNKGELTARQMLMQELKSTVSAKAENRSDDVLGYCKWGEQYDELAGVVGVRNAASGIWNFYYQKYTNVPAPPQFAKLGFIAQRDGDLQRMV